MLVQVQNPDVQRYFKTVKSEGQLKEALQQLKIAVVPLLAPLSAEERTATGNEETSSAGNGGPAL
jgi:hypothetical protein